MSYNLCCRPTLEGGGTGWFQDHGIAGAQGRRKYPNFVSILQAKEVPFGADTMWASASAAYDRLPYALKLLFLNIDIVSSWHCATISGQTTVLQHVPPLRRCSYVYRH